MGSPKLKTSKSAFNPNIIKMEDGSSMSEFDFDIKNLKSIGMSDEEFKLAKENFNKKYGYESAERLLNQSN